MAIVAKPALSIWQLFNCLRNRLLSTQRPTPPEAVQAHYKLHLCFNASPHPLQLPIPARELFSYNFQPKILHAFISSVLSAMNAYTVFYTRAEHVSV